MNGRDLILGAAIGYKSSHVRVFAQSLARSGYQGRTLLITGDLPEEEVRQMKAWGLETLPVSRFPGAFSRGVALKLMSPRATPFRGWYPGIRFLPCTSRFKNRLISRIGVHYHHTMCNRYMLYWDYLDQQPEVERVMLTDVRDVYFQSDLFGERWGEGVNVSLEDGRGSIGAGEFGITDTKYDHVTARGRPMRGVNASWIRRLYGDDVLEAVADNPISCAGVTFGNRGPLMAYLQAMIREIAKLTVRIAGGQGYDQGIHNVVLRTGRVQAATVHENGVGPVYTVHSVPDAEIPLDSRNQVLRGDGRPVAVVHQYDRSPLLNGLFSG